MSEKYPTLKERIEKAYGKRVKVDDIVDKEVVFLNVETSESEVFDQPMARVTIILDGEKAYFITFSKVLIKRLGDFAGFMPFRAKIVKRKRYYDIALE